MYVHPNVFIFQWLHNTQKSLGKHVQPSNRLPPNREKTTFYLMHVCTFKNPMYKYFLFIYLFFNEKEEQKDDPLAPFSPATTVFLCRFSSTLWHLLGQRQKCITYKGPQKWLHSKVRSLTGRHPELTPQCACLLGIYFKPTGQVMYFILFWGLSNKVSNQPRELLDQSKHPVLADSFLKQ